MQEAAFVYTTWPSMHQAEAAGRGFVEEKLCACVNILPGMVSVYAWQGSLERAEEAVMILKTRKEKVGALMDAVRAIHPYDVPAIVEVAVAGMDPRYLACVFAETAS